MQNDLECVNISFHEQANKLFFLQLEEFESAVANNNRKSEEFPYRQTREKYIKTFRQQLDTIAKNIAA